MANFKGMEQSDATKAKIAAARKGQKKNEGYALNPKIKELCADLYEGLSDAEAKILDVIIINFIRKEIFNNKTELTLEEISKITGLSRMGAQKIEKRAYAKMQKSLQKQGVSRSSDVIGSDAQRSVAQARGGSGSVD